MTSRKHSKAIKKRFVWAVEMAAKERYPKFREVDIIRSVGFIPANYYRVRSTENHYPTLDHCVLLCEKYHYSPTWLLLGKGPVKVTGKAEKASPADLLKQALTMMNGSTPKGKHG